MTLKKKFNYKYRGYYPHNIIMSFNNFTDEQEL